MKLSTGDRLTAAIAARVFHKFLHRTGILRRYKAEHAHGRACYGPGGCAAIVEEIARRFDARTINPDFPPCFPRFVQHALWRFCAANFWNICNGNQINDRYRCDNQYCPAYEARDRVSLG